MNLSACMSTLCVFDHSELILFAQTRYSSHKLLVLKRKVTWPTGEWTMTRRVMQLPALLLTAASYFRFEASRLTTAGEGMWMMDTERGRTWFTSWQRMVPLARASPISSGRVIFRRDSRVWLRTQSVTNTTLSSSYQEPDCDCVGLWGWPCVAEWCLVFPL